MRNDYIEPHERKYLAKYLRKYYSMQHGEKYTIFDFVRLFKKRHKGRIIEFKEDGEVVKKRIGTKQTFLPVSGEAGTGKSYFALICQILYGRPFNLKKNVVYMPKAMEISNKMKDLEFSTLLIDEAIKALRNTNHYDKDQQEVTMKAQTDRLHANWYFLNIPNFREMTKSLREGSSQFRVYIPYRTDTYARVIVHQKSPNFRSDDPWCDKEANDKYEKIIKRKKMLKNKDILFIERSLSSTVMDFKIPNLELILPNVTKRYLDLKEQSRKDAEDENQAEQERVDRWRDIVLPKAIRIIVDDTMGIREGVRLTKKALKTELGISNEALNTLIEKGRKL